jgi:hypothetical protein
MGIMIRKVILARIPSGKYAPDNEPTQAVGYFVGQSAYFRRAHHDDDCKRLVDGEFGGSVGDVADMKTAVNRSDK